MTWLGGFSGSTPPQSLNVRARRPKATARARWMGKVGYRYDYPGGENWIAEQLEFLRSLGISVVTVSPGNLTRH